MRRLLTLGLLAICLVGFNIPLHTVPNILHQQRRQQEERERQQHVLWVYRQGGWQQLGMTYDSDIACQQSLHDRQRHVYGEKEQMRCVPKGVRP